MGQAQPLHSSMKLNTQQEGIGREQEDFHSCWSALPEAIRCRIEQVANQPSAMGMERSARFAQSTITALAA